MSRDEPRRNRDQSQERHGDGYKHPHDALHRAAERSFAEGVGLRRAQERSNEIMVDPFLEYVRAEGQCDDYQREDRPIGECQADDCAFR